MALETRAGYIPYEVDPEAIADAEDLDFSGVAADEFAELPAEVEADVDTVSAKAHHSDPISIHREQEPVYEPERDGPAIANNDFEMLFDMFSPQLLRFLKRMVHNDEDAQDLLQDTYHNAFRGIAGGALIPMKNASPWLYRIAGNKAKDLLSRRKRTRKVMEPLYPTCDTDRSRSPEETLQAEVDGRSYPDIIDKKISVQKVLGWMPPSMAAYLLYMEEGISPKALAVHLGTTEAAIKMHGTRARKLFKLAYRHCQVHGEPPEMRYHIPESSVTGRLRYLPPAERELGFTAVAAASGQE